MKKWRDTVTFTKNSGKHAVNISARKTVSVLEYGRQSSSFYQKIQIFLARISSSWDNRRTLQKYTNIPEA